MGPKRSAPDMYWIRPRLESRQESVRLPPVGSEVPGHARAPVADHLWAAGSNVCRRWSICWSSVDVRRGVCAALERHSNTLDVAAAHKIDSRPDGSLHGGADPGHEGLDRVHGPAEAMVVNQVLALPRHGEIFTQRAPRYINPADVC